MAKKIIRTGTTADPTGDSLKNAFTKVNDNFTELYNALGLDADLLNLGAFEFTGSTMTTTDSTPVVIDQAATITSNLSVGGDILPQTANGGDLGSSTLPWRSLYVSNNTIFLGGTALSVNGAGNLLVNGSLITGGTTSYNDLTGKPTLTTVATTGAYADLTGKPTIPTLVSQLSNDSGFLTSVGNISNIQSEGDINIDINLADSTLRRWQFGEDGDLTLPSTSGFIDRLYTDNSGSRTKLEKKIESSPTTGTIAKLELDLDNGNIRLAIGNYTGGNDQWIDTSTWAFRGDTGSLTLPPAGKIINNNNEWIFGTDGVLTVPHSIFGNGTSLALSTGATAPGAAVAINTSEVNINFSEGRGGFKFTNLGGATGSITFPDATVQTTAWTGSVSDLRSEGNINIDINLSDSTLRRWQFGEDGALTLPSVGKINNGAYDWTFGSTGNTTFPTGLTLGAPRGVGTVNFTAAVDKEFQIETGTATSSKLWQFGTDGSLTIPGDIKSNGNINIDINLSDSTLRRWQFGEDGSLTLPIGVSIDDNVDPLYPKIIADSGKLFSVQGQGSTGSAALAWSVNPNTDTKYAAVGVNQGGGDNLAKVVMTAGNTTATLKVWKLDETGVFTLPTGGVIADSGNYITLTPPTGSANQSLLIYPTAGDGNHIHLTAGGGTTELYLGNDIHYVKLVNGGNVEVRANNGVNDAAWTFGTDGKLRLPNNTTLKDTAGNAIAFGYEAGLNSQSATAIAIGSSTGYYTQGAAAVAIGESAGESYQGDNAIAIGKKAGYYYQAANSIILNATGDPLEQTTANTFTVAPIRNISATSGVLQYNASTKEVSYSNSVTAETFNTDQITVVGNRITTTVTNANLELECNGTGGVVINTVADATTSSTVKSVGYLGLPQSGTSTSATLAIGDAGKHIYITTTGQTITIPAASSVAYPIGTTLTFIAGPSATTVTIAITSDTLRLAGGTSTGSRTLAANGMATAVKVSGTSSAGVWYINGVGLT